MTLPLSLPSDALSPVLLFALVVLLIVTLLSAKRARRKPAPTYPYEAREALFTPAERAFLRPLEAALQGQPYRVFGKVRLGDLVGVRAGLPQRERQGALNRVTSKHVDFVVCDLEGGRILCAVELDDKTHERPDRRARDAFLERALEAAGVPLLRVPVRRTYDVSALREALAAFSQETEPVHPGLRTNGRRRSRG